MNSHLNAVLAALIVACAALVAPARATTYTFTGNVDDDWANPNNWNPSTGFPGAGDTAIIPNNLECNVKSQNHAASVIQVAGTLGIVGFKLTLGQTDTSTSSPITGDGELRFVKPGDDTPELAIRGTVTIGGTVGTITGQISQGYGPGLITDADDPADSKLIVAANTIVEGSLTLTVDVTNNGTMQADHASDTMVFGGSEVPPTNAMDGSGNLNVSGGGTVRINAMELDGAMTWSINNGELWLTDKFTIPNTATFDTEVQVKRGTLDIDADFLTHGELIFGTIGQTATIEVASGKAAEFNVD